MTPTLTAAVELLVALPSPQAPPGLDRFSNLILGWGCGRCGWAASPAFSSPPS